MGTVERFFQIVVDEDDRLRQLKVRRLGIFGSCVRGEERPGSDVDILVEFEEKSFDHYMEVKFLFEERFGRSVDLVLADALKPAIKEQILKEVAYAA